MAEKIKKTIPWFLVLALIGVTIGISLNFQKPEVKADIATTTVTVGNATPIWVFVYEDPVSTTTTPTNAGSNVTFKGKADDPNNENWFLIICKTTGYTTTSNGTCPSCDGGVTDTWATSTTTTDNTTATIAYTTQDGDAETNDWYAYACDANVGGQLCTSVSQGTGGTADAYSPFNVNRRPLFKALSNDSPKLPGATTTWSTNASTTDNDTVGGNDTVRLMICKTNDGLNPAGDDCNGGASDRWCQSNLVANNPNCGYYIPIPTDDDASPYAAYGYLADNHGFGASATGTIPQGTSTAYTVANATPTVSSVELNNEGDIYLIEGSVTSTQITGTISDNNGDADISTGTAKAYPTDVGASGCTSQNDNTCYYNISCTLETASGDTSRNATCTISIWYHANPTGTSTPWAAETWKATLQGQDDNNATGTGETGVGIEMIPLAALDITTGEIAYGTLSPNQQRDVNVTSTVAATGNCALDNNLSGTDMTGPDTITVDNQKYATTTGSYGSTGAQLSTSTVEFELELAKTTNHTSTSTKNIYWGLNVPGGKLTGGYSGQNTFGAIMDETPWP
jgi:hypothetical protein